jgi:citrate/tricarballylate utilization protein
MAPTPVLPLVEVLGNEASALPLEEAQRQFTICNACRYCEGYCAVFPEMELRSAFTAGDVSYLANLCHDCRACYQACMYAPPHEFAIDIPALMAQARTASWREYARPRWLGALFERGALALAVALVVGLVLSLALVALGGGLGLLDDPPRDAGAFYALVPHTAMVVVFASTGRWRSSPVAAAASDSASRRRSPPRARPSP